MTEQRKIKTYFAAPYTTPSAAENVAAYWRAVAAYMRMCELADPGTVIVPVCPHAYHYLAQVHDFGYEHWMTLDFELIRGCQVLVRLPGFSSGADREVDFAHEIGVGVVDYHATKWYGESMTEMYRLLVDEMQARGHVLEPAP